MKRKKKQTQADLKREWGVPVDKQLRYKGLKGILWYYTSIQIRKDDFTKYSGECIDQCGKRAKDWREFDCGHFVPASNCGFGLLFDRENLHGQLKGCNNPTFSPHSLIGFAIGIDKRLGKGKAEELFRRKGEFKKEWSKEEYAERIRALPSYQEQLSTTIIRQGD